MRYLVIVEFDVSDPPLRYFVGVSGEPGRCPEDKAIEMAIEQDFQEQRGVEDYERLSENSVSNVIVIDETVIESCMKEADEG